MNPVRYWGSGNSPPNKAPCSLSLAQYQNLLKVIPQLNADLRAQGHAIEDPDFAQVAEQTDAPVETPKVKAMESKKESTKTEKKKPRKSNIDVTSDEEEAAEDEDDDE